MKMPSWSAGGRRRAVRPYPPVRAWAVAGIGGEVVLLVVLTVALFPSLRGVYRGVFDEDQSAGPELGVTLSEVVDHPDPMWGASVTISARVDRVIDARTMLIGNDKPVVGDKVLVVGTAELVRLLDQPAPLIPVGAVAQVTGVVRPFDIPALEAATGADLDDAALAGYDRRSAMVVDAIALNPGGIGQGDPEMGASAGYDSGVTIQEIRRDPERYLGQSVLVSGEVERVFGPYAFWVRDVGVLVISPTPRPGLFDESSAYVRGEARRFDRAALEAELGIDLDDGRLAEFAGQPVIVAEWIVQLR
jgi:hypothetical protein